MKARPCNYDNYANCTNNSCFVSADYRLIEKQITIQKMSRDVVPSKRFRQSVINFGPRAIASTEASGSAGVVTEESSVDVVERVSHQYGVDAVELTCASTSSRDVSALTEFLSPNQPSTNEGIPTQQLAKRTLKFQTSWFKSYEWLHYSNDIKGVICFTCAKATELGLLTNASKTDKAFITTGYSNWKKALEKFADHQNSGTHHLAVNQMRQLKMEPVTAQISTQVMKAQQSARIALLKEFETIQFLARQGLALRGRDSDSGNYAQLLKLRSKDVPELVGWLSKVTNFTSPESQNEMLSMLSHTVLKGLIATVRQQSQQYAIIMDGTQDCSGIEQESLCIRYVDDDLNPQEIFVGLYEPPDTRGTTLANIIEDVLIRFNLPIADLRAQTYDGAANMSGEYRGCQAIISEKQPLAPYFHCGGHISNLVAQSTAQSCSLVRDAIQWAHELGVLFGRSGKCKDIFAKIAVCETGSYINIKPLCPTRWLCRTPAIRSLITQYESVLASLTEMSQSMSGESATKANGLLERFEQGSTYLGLLVALNVFSVLDQFNAAMQARSATIGGMLEAVSVVKSILVSMRTEEEFKKLLNEATTAIEKLQINPVQLPRARRPPARYSGPATAHHATTVDEHFRTIYFEIIDTALNHLTERFDGKSKGLEMYLKLECCLLTGEIESETIDKYPELDKETLIVQLAMFRKMNKYSTLQDCQAIFNQMSPEVRGMFSQVERVIRLMLICPVTSCESERSFSALRRLKTWLRTNMTQTRLNAVAICHVHQESLDAIDLIQLASEFITRSQIRLQTFGKCYI